MGTVFVCDECGGAGAHGYERGPAVERCPRCAGVGLVFADPATAARDFLHLITGVQGSELSALGEGGALRALAALTARLEARCEQLQQDLDSTRDRG
jgi:hypothetical protein